MIPGILISIITFPGVMVHEWAHKFFCDRLGVRVLEVVYFRFGNPAGYVAHEKPTTFSQVFWISVGPLIVNSISGIILGAVAFSFGHGEGLNALFFWLSYSVGMHAFPSDHDASHILEKSKTQIKQSGPVGHYAAYPFFWLIWLANKLRFFWFDLFYATGLYFLGESLIKLFE